MLHRIRKMNDCTEFSEMEFNSEIRQFRNFLIIKLLSIKY